MVGVRDDVTILAIDIKTRAPPRRLSPMRPRRWMAAPVTTNLELVRNAIGMVSAVVLEVELRAGRDTNLCQ